MKNRRLFALLVLACASCHANDLPVVGVIEQVPVMADGVNVSARPIYVLTDQKLSGPAVFSALQGFGSILTVACCFEVANTAPTSLDAELAKYGKDPEFAAHMKSIRGYRYIYTAQPKADKRHWTPLMKTLARNASDPNDASPFSAAAVAAQFDGNPTDIAYKAGLAAVVDANGSVSHVSVFKVDEDGNLALRGVATVNGTATNGVAIVPPARAD